MSGVKETWKEVSRNRLLQGLSEGKVYGKGKDFFHYKKEEVHSMRRRRVVSAKIRKGRVERKKKFGGS